MDLREGQTVKPFRLWSPLMNVFLVAITLVSLLFLISRFELSHYFPIRTVKIYGVNNINEETIRLSLMPLVNRDFFTINVDAIHDRLLDIPWISELYVRRIWPDQIIITIKEKRPVARWNNSSLLSDAGELFFPQELYRAHLPNLRGPEGKHIFLLKYLNNMNRLFAPLHVKIVDLELTPYYTWKLTLSNGVNLQIGYKESLTRLDQFVKVYPKIVGNKATEVKYIDLRYSNGAAVRWKS